MKYSDLITAGADLLSHQVYRPGDAATVSRLKNMIKGGKTRMKQRRCEREGIVGGKCKRHSRASCRGKG